MKTKQIIRDLSIEYNNEDFFINDPIIFPKHFVKVLNGSEPIFKDKPNISSIQDIEIAGIIAAHLAWGRRDMIVRDITRAMDEMGWEPYNSVMGGKYKDDDISLHRTIKWSDFAVICNNLRDVYREYNTIEHFTPNQLRTKVYSKKSDLKAANKKIHMFRRWMVRNDDIVDLGVWRNISPSDLIIPLDVHVHRSALNLGITNRKSADIITANEITNYLKTIFPDDPCKGDFALFAYAATNNENKTK